MFSRYKKTDEAGPKLVEVPKSEQPNSAAPAPESKPQNRRKPSPQKPTTIVPMDKEKKRKARLGDIKVELHKRLLDDLNLSALENATESDLRAEISQLRAKHWKNCPLF